MSCYRPPRFSLIAAAALFPPPRSIVGAHLPRFFYSKKKLSMFTQQNIMSCNVDIPNKIFPLLYVHCLYIEIILLRSFVTPNIFSQGKFIIIILF
jgi:hypothetical protein